MIFTKKFDIHSIIHFVGCYALVPTIMQILSTSDTWAAIIATILAMTWEVFDEINNRKSLNIWFLDSRGADILDAITDIAAILLAVLIF
jgi:VanZ family protein